MFARVPFPTRSSILMSTRLFSARKPPDLTPGTLPTVSSPGECFPSSACPSCTRWICPTPSNGAADSPSASTTINSNSSNRPTTAASPLTSLSTSLSKNAFAPSGSTGPSAEASTTSPDTTTPPSSTATSIPPSSSCSTGPWAAPSPPASASSAADKNSKMEDGHSPRPVKQGSAAKRRDKLPRQNYPQTIRPLRSLLCASDGCPVLATRPSPV